MKKRKRGQITLYIVLGIVILLITSLGFYYYKTIRQITVVHDDNAKDNIRVFTQQCIDKLANEGAFHMALHGGYEYSPSSLYWKGYSFAYQYEGGSPVIITRSQVEMNYEHYVQSRLPLCVDNFNAFREMNIGVRSKQPVVDVKISDDEINVNVVYEITATEGEQTYSIKDFNPVKIKARLGRLHESAETLIYYLAADPVYLPISKIDNLAMSIGVKISYDVNGQSIAFVFDDPNSKFEGEFKKLGAYQYVFAANYN